MARDYFAPRGIACFAHRGGAAHWPENTLEAFRGGLAAGCAWIETDVHMTRDGHVVCLHDHDLRRTTNGEGPVWELSLAQLRELDAGYRFSPNGRDFPFRGRGVRVPTLEEVLELDPAARVNLEIKQARPAMVETLWRRIEALGVEQRVLVASEDARLVQAFRRASRGAVATSAGKAEIFAFWLASRAKLSPVLRIDYDALQVPVRFLGLEVVNERFVTEAHRRGLQVHVWTIDDLDQMRWLMDLGVDGIMTDEPARLAELARSRGLMPEVAVGGRDRDQAQDQDQAQAQAQAQAQGE